jgi:hypothetical protein
VAETVDDLPDFGESGAHGAQCSQEQLAFGTLKLSFVVQEPTSGHG